MGRLDAKVALVTGSTQGLGEAIAHEFVSEGAAAIVVCGRNAERGEAVAAALTDRGAEAVFVRVELGDATSVENLAAAADARFGRLDVLVNAAGLSTRGTIVDTSVELWDQLMAVNVRAPFQLIQAATRMMRRESIRGSIVNIGSVTAYGGLPFLTAYAASKGALMILTKNVAFSLARDQIRVNQLNIGWMDTPGEDTIQRRFHSGGTDWLDEAEAAAPFGRLLKPAEVARAVAFLASADSGMMTGSVIDFDQSVIGAGLQPQISEDEVPR